MIARRQNVEVFPGQDLTLRFDADESVPEGADFEWRAESGLRVSGEFDDGEVVVELDAEDTLALRWNTRYQLWAVSAASSAPVAEGKVTVRPAVR